LIQSLEPAVTGWFGRVNPFEFRADVLDWSSSARRFETGSPPVPSVYAAAAGIELVLAEGLSSIHARIADLVSRFASVLESRGFATLTPHDPARRGPLVVVRTYSKVWSLAAVRLGFAVAPTWVIGELGKVLLPYNLSVPTQLAGTIALDFWAEMEQRVASLVEERGRLYAALAELARIDVCPSGANFLLFRVDGDAHDLWKRLLARDVLVRDFSSWPRVENCLRVTVGTRAENDAFLAAIGEALPEVCA
jgi:selenocysteine lyase/cysteine desulfurase